MNHLLNDEKHCYDLLLELAGANTILTFSGFQCLTLMLKELMVMLINKKSNEKMHENHNLFNVSSSSYNIRNVFTPSLSIRILISVKGTRQPSYIDMNILRLNS